MVNSETLPKEARNRFVDELSKEHVDAPFPKKWSKLDLDFDVCIGDSEKEPPYWGTQKQEEMRSDRKTWIDFLVANGYLKEVGRETVVPGYYKCISIKYQPTSKLLPYIGRYDSGLEYLIIAKPQLHSIGKVEKHIKGDYDVYRFAFTFYLESFPELPKLGPYKKVGVIRYNRLTEKYEIDASAARYFYDECEKSLIDSRQKWMPKSQSTSTSHRSQSKDAELQKLQALITDQWKQVIQIPPPTRDWRELVTLKITGKYDDYSSLYLLGVNRRNLASDALASADKFLKNGDLKNAQKYADLGARCRV